MIPVFTYLRQVLAHRAYRRALARRAGIGRQYRHHRRVERAEVAS